VRQEEPNLASNPVWPAEGVRSAGCWLAGHELRYTDGGMAVGPKALSFVLLLSAVSPSSTFSEPQLNAIHLDFAAPQTIEQALPESDIRQPGGPAAEAVRERRRQQELAGGEQAKDGQH